MYKECHPCLGLNVHIGSLSPEVKFSPTESGFRATSYTRQVYVGYIHKDL